MVKDIGMVSDRKVRPQYEVAKREGRSFKEHIYVQNSKVRQTWKATVVSGRTSKMLSRTYDMKSMDAVDAQMSPPDCDIRSPLKKRFMNGNILILMLPLGASVMPTVFFIGAYLHADEYNLLKLKNHTDVPYISDIGNYKPHSSVFSFGLSLGAMFGFWLILVRHIQVEKLYENTGSKANLAASICGLLGILGELVVSSFQLSSHFTIHYLGAFSLFFSIMIFMFIQTFITHRNLPKEGKRKYAVTLVIVRGVLSALLLISIVLFGTFLLPSLSAYNRKGYSVAQSAEWVMLGCVILFMLTFLYDFKDLICEVNLKYITKEGPGQGRKQKVYNVSGKSNLALSMES